MDFLRSGIYFASVDITNDKIAMKRTWGIEIPAECHIDLQDMFKLDRERIGMADMASALIDEEYMMMMKNFPKTGHKFWEKKPLDPINIEYAARDGYVAYELYRRIGVFNYGRRHLVPLVPPPVPRESPAWGSSDPAEPCDDAGWPDEYCLQWRA